MNTALQKRFYWVGMAEAISFIALLGIAMPLKYFADMPKAVSVVGMAHGVLFLAYLYVAFDCMQTFKWPFKKFALAFIAAFLPFGPFWFHKRFDQ
jgi:integral membrane protein